MSEEIKDEMPQVNTEEEPEVEEPKEEPAEEETAGE